jgi:hypothetical protein
MDRELATNVRPFVAQNEETGCSILAEKADSFLANLRWAKGHKGLWVACCVPDVIGIFKVELDTAEAKRNGLDIDEHIWILVGDLPPAYLSCEYARSPKDALDGYLGEMNAWVEAVEKGEPIEDLIPVNGAPTPANAQALRNRLEFLAREILPRLSGRTDA